MSGTVSAICRVPSKRNPDVTSYAKRKESSEDIAGTGGIDVCSVPLAMGLSFFLFFSFLCDFFSVTFVCSGFGLGSFFFVSFVLPCRRTLCGHFARFTRVETYRRNMIRLLAVNNLTDSALVFFFSFFFINFDLLLFFAVWSSKPAYFCSRLC